MAERIILFRMGDFIMDDNKGLPPEAQKSFITIEFDAMGSTKMTIHVGNIVPAQMAVASWYLLEQSKLGLYAQMEQQAQLEQAKHIQIATTKH